MPKVPPLTKPPLLRGAEAAAAMSGGGAVSPPLGIYLLSLKSPAHQCQFTNLTLHAALVLEAAHGKDADRMPVSQGRHTEQ